MRWMNGGAGALILAALRLASGPATLFHGPNGTRHPSGGLAPALEGAKAAGALAPFECAQISFSS